VGIRLSSGERGEKKREEDEEGSFRLEDTGQKGVGSSFKGLLVVGVQ
jgi:hypothetical protein